jgi:sulfur relay (sulfurtransferase) complex TusBCD TusD component (DsrE family)
MAKTFTLFLGTAPYMSENTLTAVRLAGSALRKGHTVNLIASGDGVGLSLRRMSELSPCRESRLPRRDGDGLPEGHV